MLPPDCLDVHGALPSQNIKKHATVMLVGTPASGKRRIARTLLAIGTDIQLAIRTTGKLPLGTGKEGVQRPRIQFIVFVVDMTSAQSFESMIESCKNIGVNFLLGRCCFVGTKGDIVSRCSVTRADMIQWASALQCPAMFANLLDVPQIENLARKVLTRVEVACGYRSHVTPMLLDAATFYRVNSTSLPS